MSPVENVSQVFDAIQKVKSVASTFCTNFFPSERKLQVWIQDGRLLQEFHEEAVFFIQRDRDFWRFYYCAASAPALQRGLETFSGLRRERMVMDLVGQEAMPGGMLDLFEPAGFRLYTRLCRLTRTGQTGSQHSQPDRLQVVCANRTDGEVIFDLLDRAFDRYAEQLPVLSEIEAAIESRQILTIRHDGQLAALLFYETKGFTSTVRYWLVAEQFRSRRFGSALMRYYFASQSAVRRFILWVVANNENAVQKYRHYGYAPDGLVDHIFVNEMIRP